MTQLDRSVAPAIRQLEHFSILQPELHRMKNGMPLYVLSAGNEDVIRFDLLVRSGQLDQSQPLQAVFTNRMLREGTVRMTSGVMPSAQAAAMASFISSIESAGCPGRFSMPKWPPEGYCESSESAPTAAKNRPTNSYNEW